MPLCVVQMTRRTSVGHFDTAKCVVNGVNELVKSVLSLTSSTFQVCPAVSFSLEIGNLG